MLTGLFINLTAIDPPPRRFAPYAPRIDRTSAQARMMKKALRVSTQCLSPAFTFAHYIEAEGYDPPDPCTWTGVECDGGAVRVFRMTGVENLVEGHRKWEIRAEWLPSTIHEIHLAEVLFINGLRTDLLPRELRYLSLSGCGDLKWNFRFDRLPKQMEYLSISQEDRNFGPVHIGTLPETMKVIKIVAYHISSTIIDRHFLPADLEKIVVNSAWGSGLVDVDGEALDARVSTAKDPHWLVPAEEIHTQYIQQYQENFLQRQRQAVRDLYLRGR